VLREGRAAVGRREYRHKDGTPLHLDLSASVITLAGRPVFTVVFRDVSGQMAAEERVRQYQAELERANAQLHALATTDGLTGVKNRSAFDDALAEEFDRSVRYDHPLSVAMLDVDHFKAFNDTFGHPAGDGVLRRLAGLLQHTVRGADVVARYGGEEFAVILPETDAAGAVALAERCRRAVAADSWDKRPITVSVGVSTLTPATADAAALVKDADDALYHSKHTGRNRVSHGSAAVTPPPLRALPVGG
jgi:diguanylate cyclase (GGDEF)-like protein